MAMINIKIQIPSFDTQWDVVGYFICRFPLSSLFLLFSVSLYVHVELQASKQAVMAV